MCLGNQREFGFDAQRFILLCGVEIDDDEGELGAREDHGVDRSNARARSHHRQLVAGACVAVGDRRRCLPDVRLLNRTHQIRRVVQFDVEQGIGGRVLREVNRRGTVEPQPRGCKHDQK